MLRSEFRWVGLCAVFTLLGGPAIADVSLPSIFSDHMVLQRDMPCPVWGTAAPGEEVAVQFAGQEKTTTADANGDWRVALDPLSAPGGGEMTIAGENTITLADVAVGEVWVCSGQSNMEWPLSAAFNAELEIAAGDNANIRLVSVLEPGTQVPQKDFHGQWRTATRDGKAMFSAVGLLFGKRVQEALDVPVGLIDNAWGGSACEAWVPQAKLQGVEIYKPLLERWKQQEEDLDEQAARAEHEKTLDEWRKKVAPVIAAGRTPWEPPNPRHVLIGNHRPGNLYNARVAPIATYAIRGAIWYQGETNAGRAEQYRDLFPLMIQSWRDAWQQGDFSFYWVQLADFMAERDQPRDSAWAELRDAQTMTLDRLENTGQAVIIDIGNGIDIHPRNKQEVANRLARHALAKDYGLEIHCESPRFDKLSTQDGKAIVKLTSVGRGLKTLDRKKVEGFAIAGEDRQWVSADAKIVGRDSIEVSSSEVPNPVAVRYAWADNPVCNLYSAEGLPATPFRSDDWPGVSTGK